MYTNTEVRTSMFITSFKRAQLYIQHKSVSADKQTPGYKFLNQINKYELYQNTNFLNTDFFKQIET